MKIHFAPETWDKTLCGRTVNRAPRGMTVLITADPHKVTCIRCKSGPYLDEYLANWHA